jgi:hypothetical protein
VRSTQLLEASLPAFERLRRLAIELGGANPGIRPASILPLTVALLAAAFLGAPIRLLLTAALLTTFIPGRHANLQPTTRRRARRRTRPSKETLSPAPWPVKHLVTHLWDLDL